MIRRANGYLDGIERRSGEDVGFAANCDRLENGLRTTNNPNAGWSTMGAGPPTPGDPSVELFKMNCKDQFNSGMYNFITEARERRFSLVDEERGIVLAAFIFVHPGDILAIDVPGIGRIPYPQSVLRPFDTLLLEIQDRIRRDPAHQRRHLLRSLRLEFRLGSLIDRVQILKHHGPASRPRDPPPMIGRVP